MKFTPWRALALAGALSLASLPIVARAQLAPSGSVNANATASAGPMKAVTATAWLDRWCSSTNNQSIFRTSGTWVCSATIPTAMQDNITRLGTIVSGVWNGTTVASGFGGTSNAFFAVSGPASSTKTYTFPNSNSTMAALGTAQTWTALQGFNDGFFGLNGSSSGQSLLKAPATGGGTVTFFAGSDTVVGKATTDTLTNKSLTAPVVTGLGDVQGAVKYSTQSAPSQITSNQNDYNPSSVVCATSQTLLINSDAARDVTGIAGGVAGCPLKLVNNGSFTITLKNLSASSTAGNQISAGGDVGLVANGLVDLLYDGPASKWRVVSPPLAGAGSGTVTSVATGGLATGGTITTSGTITVTAATQSDQETATSTTTAVTPAVQKYHPAAAKVWLFATQAAGSYTNQASYNVASVNKGGTGQLTIGLTTAFSSALYACVASGSEVSSTIVTSLPSNASTVTVDIRTSTSGANVDRGFSLTCYGDQ